MARNPEHDIQIVKHAVHAKRIHTIHKDIVVYHLIHPVVMDHHIRGAVSIDVDRIGSIHVKYKEDDSQRQNQFQRMPARPFPGFSRRHSSELSLKFHKQRLLTDLSARDAADPAKNSLQYRKNRISMAKESGCKRKQRPDHQRQPAGNMQKLKQEYQIHDIEISGHKVRHKFCRSAADPGKSFM